MDSWHASCCACAGVAPAMSPQGHTQLPYRPLRSEVDSRSPMSLPTANNQGQRQLRYALRCYLCLVPVLNLSHACSRPQTCTHHSLPNTAGPPSERPETPKRPSGRPSGTSRRLAGRPPGPLGLHPGPPRGLAGRVERSRRPSGDLSGDLSGDPRW